MLEAIRFKNCQSLSDCILPFTRKLNVIAAENNTGKSVLYKVLKLAGRADYYTREERRDLIRRGTEEAQITFKFDDGAYALMKVTPGKTLYAFLNNAKDNIAWYLEPPDLMIKHLGLLVSNTEAFIANIIDMDQGLLLVNPRLQSNYELIKMITTCESLDELREKLDSLIDEFRGKCVRAADSVNFVERQLTQLEYYDVEALEKKYKIASLAKDWLFKCCNIFEEITLIGKVSAKHKDFNNLIVVVDVLDTLGKFSYFIPKCGVGKRRFWECEVKALTVGEQLLVCAKRAAIKRPLPGGCETLLVMEECMLSIKSLLYKVSIPEYQDKSKLFVFLELLERLVVCLGAVTIREEPVGLVLPDTLSWAESLLRAVKLFVAASAVTKTDAGNVALWEEKFIKSGESVECPIWGEVIFDGKSCSVKEVSGG